MKTNEQKLLEFIFDNECKSYADAYFKALKINNGGNVESHMIKDQWTDKDVIQEILKVKNQFN